MTDTGNNPTCCMHVRRKLPCTDLQLWGAYVVLLLAVLMFAFLIYSQQRVLALVLLFFASGVTLFLCLRQLCVHRRRGTTDYREVPWSGGETTEPLDPSSLPSDTGIELLETGGNRDTLTPGASTRRDEMIVVQLQLMELQQARREAAQARRFGRRERDRQRGLARLGFVPTSENGGSTHLQVSMLDRELGPNDYDMLLKLDDELVRTRVRQTPHGQALPGGLSSSQINLFPSFIMPPPSEPSLKELKEDPSVQKGGPLANENCAVCLEPKVPGEVLRTVPCLHTFHVQCIDPWLQLKRTCPVCKMDFAQQA